MYFPVPPLTKANSPEDERIVLKVEESEEQKKEIKNESGVEHHDTKEEEQFNEPSTSSGSACPEVKCTFFSDLLIFMLLIGVKPTLLCTGSGKGGCVQSVPMFLFSHWPFRPAVSVEHRVGCGTGLSRGAVSVCRWAAPVPFVSHLVTTLRWLLVVLMCDVAALAWWSSSEFPWKLLKPHQNSHVDGNIGCL